MCDRLRSMRLHINNIGAIRDADMRLEGITVLTGENGTGKSTVCRTLFATVKALRKGSDDVRRSRRRSTYNLLVDYLMRGDHAFEDMPESSLSETADALVAMLPEQVDDSSVAGVIDRSLPSDGPDDEAERALLMDRLRKRLSFSDEEVLRQLRGDVLRGEHVSGRGARGADGYAEVEFPGRPLTRLTVQGDATVNPRPENPLMGLTTDVTMLDDPRLLDRAGVSSFRSAFWGRGDAHASDLAEKILSRGETDAVTTLANNDSIAGVLNALRDHAGGDLIVDRYGLKFKEDGLGRDLDMRDVSDGRKTFIMLLQLLSGNRVGEDDVLILDEPEIHLHPAWQLDLAEMLVELRRAFHLTILVSTHSPYFLEALETYTDHQGMADETSYYMMRRQDGVCVCEDVTHRLEQAYGLLAAPFDRLDDETGMR
ncbi:hypothetical protein BcFMB_06285 [Bifidobacterium choerinum]|uniref:ABC transporter ATP-binding protein n=2 Tax=Bifidobacterium choerinum TaxID=35760 RepID=A0A2D3D611_9BIFI|nr:hypothetical protein BcFMB_06285 [Bifidobacterium choerinum]